MLMKKVRQLTKSKRSPRAVGAAFDVQRNSDDTLDLSMLVGVGQNAAEEWTHSVDEERTKTIPFLAYHPKTVQLDKYDQVTLLLDAVLIFRAIIVSTCLIPR